MNLDQKQRDELLDGNWGDLVDGSSRSPVGPSSCTGFVHRPARANSPSTFDRVWLGAAMLFLSGCIQGFAPDGWRELTENYPAWVEGPTTWTRRSVFVGGLAMGFVLVWQRVQGRRGGKQA